MTKKNPILIAIGYLGFQFPSMEEVWKELVLSCTHSPSNPNQDNPDPSWTIPTRKVYNGSINNNSCFVSSFNSPSETTFSASISSTCFPYPLTSFPINQSSEEKESPADLKFKRRMKNRESAARSRARRMAYIMDLERKNSRLKNENARLTREIHQLKVGAAAKEEAPKKRNCSRSLSASF